MLSNHREKMHMRKMSNKKSQLDAKPIFYFLLDQYILFQVSGIQNLYILRIVHPMVSTHNCAVDCRLSK